MPYWFPHIILQPKLNSSRSLHLAIHQDNIIQCARLRYRHELINAFIVSSKTACGYTQEKENSRGATKFLTIRYLSFTIMQVSSYKLIHTSMYIQTEIALAYVVPNPCIYTGSSYLDYRRKHIRIAAHFLEVTGDNFLSIFCFTEF
jgi:hypothetical protein